MLLSNKFAKDILLHRRSFSTIFLTLDQSHLIQKRKLSWNVNNNGYVSQVKKCKKKKETKVFSRQNTRANNYFRDQSGIGTVYLSISKDGLAHLLRFDKF